MAGKSAVMGLLVGLGNLLVKGFSMIFELIGLSQWVWCSLVGMVPLGLNITLFLLHVESLTGGFLPLVMWLTFSPLAERKLALLGLRLELFLLGVLVFLIKVSEDSELLRKHLVQLSMGVSV